MPVPETSSRVVMDDVDVIITTTRSSGGDVDDDGDGLSYFFLFLDLLDDRNYCCVVCTRT